MQLCFTLLYSSWQIYLEKYCNVLYEMLHSFDNPSVKHNGNEYCMMFFEMLYSLAGTLEKKIVLAGSLIGGGGGGGATTLHKFQGKDTDHKVYISRE